MPDYTRGDDPIYDGFRESWAAQEVRDYNRDREIRANDSDGISTERHAEICAAESEGRVVVLPCKVGQRVFIVCDDVIEEYEIYRYIHDSFNDQNVRFYAECKSDEEIDDLDFWADDVGKCAHLTREAALAALAGDGEAK